MKKLIPLLLILLSAALVFSTSQVTAKSAPGKKTVELSYKMSAGQTYNMISESSTSIKTEQMGESINVEMKTSNDVIYRVLEAKPDGIMNYEVEYKAMTQSAKSPMGDNESDFSAWIGKKVQFSLTPRGVLSDFKGFDLLPDISSATGEKVTGAMTQKNMINVFFELPDHPVKMGETWTVKTSEDIPYAGSTLKSEVSTTYTATETVKKDGLNCLRIDAIGVQKLTGKFEQQGTELELTRDTKSVEVIYFAIDKGMYLSIEATSTGASQIYVPVASMTIPQEITSSQTVKVTFN
jgi:hypothetical protein